MLAAGLLVGCTETVAQHGIEGPVRLGQIADVGGPLVRPDRLIEDSRCPGRTQCVWAGRVVLRATVSGGGWSKQIDLMLGEPVSVADGRLTLVAVEPGRGSGGQSRPRQLRFTFSFEGGL